MDYGNLKVPEKVTPEVQAILDRYEARNKEIENAHRKEMAKQYGGVALQIGSALIPGTLGLKAAGGAIKALTPYVATGLGGGLYELGQGIMEGDKAPELLKKTGIGAGIGAGVGAVAGKALPAFAKSKAGQAIGNQAGKLYNSFADTKIGQKVAEITPKVEDLLMTDIKAFNPFKQTVYHGSPADFNKFDNAYIGTGEGAQAHGYGHYAAKNKDVADERYRKGLKTTTFKIENPEKIVLPMDLDKDLIQIHHFGKNEIIKRLNNQIKNYEDLKITDPNNAFAWQELIDDFNRRIKNIEEYSNKNLKVKEDKGQLYKLSIPKDDVMLREGATFAEQPVKVQEMYRQAQKNKLAERLNEIQETKDFLYRDLENAKKNGSDRLIYATEQMLNDELPTLNHWTDDITEQLKNIDNKDYFDNLGYRELLIDLLPENSRPALERLTDQEAKIVSERLNNAGIKGISYNGGIDGEARVIFNPDDIEIVRKYYNQPNLYDYLMKNSPNIGAATNAIEDILRNPIYPMGDGFKNYEKLGLDYYKNNLQPNPVEIEGYGTVHFGKHNRGKDDITNFRVYPDLREQLMGATRGERTNYNDEADRMYDYFYNTYKGDLYKYLIEDIEGLGKRYKKMRNMRTNK